MGRDQVPAVSREYGEETQGRTLSGRRRKRPRYWDMTPEEALANGLPLERAQSQVPSQAGDGNAYKVYCGFSNLTIAPNEEELRQFFNVTMVAAQGANRKPGDSVIGVYVSPERRYAFISFRSREEAIQALDLDGINFRGQRLRLGVATHAQGSGTSRTTPFVRPAGIKHLNIERLGIMSTQVHDGPNKLYIGSLPNALSSDQVQELLSTYGHLKAFYLFTEPTTGQSKGYAFAEYRDPSVTKSAIHGLDGLQVGDRRITVRVADSGISSNTPTSVMRQLGLERKTAIPPSEIVCFLQMVTEADLKDTGEYNGICEDVREEAGKFGKVINIIIPRPEAGQRVPGIGKVFVEMDSVESARKIKQGLEGRQFLGRTVLATFFDKGKFILRQL